MSASDQGDGDIRRPAVAGLFYPGTAGALRAAVEEAFRAPLGPGALPVAVEGARRPLGLIVPHASYPYSAQGAAWAFAEEAKGGPPEAAVILGVNHRGAGAPLALSPARGWATPLGVMPVATALADRLRDLDPDLRADARAHAQEHSLEVQLPFLHYLFGALPILPIALGAAAVSDVVRLGRALALLAREADVLLIASTDFSHYVTQSEAERLDRLALEKILALDAAGMVEVVRKQGITMCGVLPVAALLTAATDAGVRDARLLHYHTSGDVTGDHREVVGYGAVALFR